MVGQRLLQYEILDKLGEGGMGVVYKARDTRLLRLAAVKVLPLESTLNEERRQRFVQEARTASSLNHPNIVTIYDIAESGGVHFIAMEYIAGKTLHAVIGRKPMDVPDVLEYAIQIADALTRAHAAGVVHRDLKPANIMIVDRQIKILDFGLAKLIGTVPPGNLAETATGTLATPFTHDGVVLGTTPYMSPEQAEGKAVDGRSDIFSFGAVLYEMATGRRAFSGDTNMSVLSAILRDDPAPVSEVAPRVPRDLEKIITRCLRKDPSRRFQNILDVKLALEDVKQDLASGTLTPHLSSPNRRGWFSPLIVAPIAALLIAIAVAVSWKGRTRTESAPQSLTRLTFDSGTSDYPALSPDGKLLAYASDRAGQNNLDLWIKQVPSGEPLRLTHDRSDEYDASFSPDGTRIAYRSEQDGGGIYVISALGGEPRLLVQRGRSPRFSPDGSEILYRVTSSADSFWGDLYVLPATGGSPRRIETGLATALSAVWTPDGKHILFWGATNLTSPRDWWVSSLSGGAAIRTGAVDVFKQQGLDAAAPASFVPGENRILFYARSAGFFNIWQISISPANWKITSAAQKVTFGSSDESGPSAGAGGRLAFNSSVWNTDIWAVPLDPNSGKTNGELQRLTQDAAFDCLPSSSADGTKIAFLSDRGQPGKLNAWLKPIPSGQESQVTFTGDLAFFAIIAPDGSKVAYPRAENDLWAVYLVNADGSNSEKLCSHCGEPRGWSPDGRRIITQSGGRDSKLYLLDSETRAHTELLRHPVASLYSPQFSPDGAWIAFGARFKPGDERLFVVPIRNGAAPQDEAQWIPITSGPALDNKPRWSPDSNLLYFTSDRDEFTCVWAQRLNPTTKQRAGTPFPVLHLHGAVRSFAKSGAPSLEISIARDKLVFHLDEIRGNIWMTQLPN